MIYYQSADSIKHEHLKLIISESNSSEKLKRKISDKVSYGDVNLSCTRSQHDKTWLMMQNSKSVLLIWYRLQTGLSRKTSQQCLKHCMALPENNISIVSYSFSSYLQLLLVTVN